MEKFADRFGPSIHRELAAAGLAGLVHSISPDTGEMELAEGITPEQGAAILAVAAANDPDALDISVAVAHIERMAGEARNAWSIHAPWKDAAYIRKEMKAREWVNADAPKPDDPYFAVLKGEADILGVSVDALAQSILLQAAAFDVPLGKIEGIRRKANAEIQAATSPEQIEAVKSALAFPQP